MQENLRAQILESKVRQAVSKQELSSRIIKDHSKELLKEAKSKVKEREASDIESVDKKKGWID